MFTVEYTCHLTREKCEFNSNRFIGESDVENDLTLLVTKVWNVVARLKDKNRMQQEALNSSFYLQVQIVSKFSCRHYYHILKLKLVIWVEAL